MKIIRTNTLNVELYDILKTDLKLSETKARAFTRAITNEIKNDIKLENSGFTSEIKEDFLKLDLQFEQLNTKIEQSKNNTLKWFIGLFITLFIMILGLYATILLKN